MNIDDRHGSPYDRGRADSYYRRARSPHYMKSDINGYVTFNSARVSEKEMTAQQIAEYNLGFDENEADQNFKEWE
jgi:hypothetical protein